MATVHTLADVNSQLKDITIKHMGETPCGAELITIPELLVTIGTLLLVRTYT